MDNLKHTWIKVNWATWKFLWGCSQNFEFKWLAELDKVTDLSSWGKVNEIVPQSEKMQELIGQLMDESAART